MKTGDIYWVNLDPTRGDEIKKKRPVVVLNSGHQKHLKLAIVVPITSWSSYWETNPFFVPVLPNANTGLEIKSAIDCFQIRAISHERFVEKIGTISNATIQLVKKSLALILDIDSEDCE